MKRILSLFMFFILMLSSPLRAQEDLMICIDTSGSMRFQLLPGGANIPGTCLDMESVTPDPGGVHPSTTRYQIARNALLDISCSLLAEMANEDEIGEVHVVRFPEYGSPNPQTFTSTCENPFENSSSPSCKDIFDFLTNNISINCAHGEPLTAGLLESNNLLTSGCLPGTAGIPSSSTPLNRMILLICDGQPTDGMNLTNLNTRLRDNVCDNVQINAIGIGNYVANNYFQLLYEIAKTRRGLFYGYVPLSGIPGTWGSAPGASQVDDFTNKAQILTQLETLFVTTLGYAAISDPSGFLSLGEYKDSTFIITPLDTNLIVAVHWDTSQNQNITAKIILPDQTEIKDSSSSLPAHYAISRANRSIYFVFFQKFIEQNYGIWTLRLQADQNNQNSVQYSFSIYTRSPLIANTQFTDSTFKTGDYLNGKSYVEFQNELLKNISVTASYKAPTNWRGNWNAKQELNDEELSLIKQGNVSSWPWAKDTPLIDRKSVYLQRAKDRTFTELFDSTITTIEFYDDGYHDDGSENDGIYNNNFLELSTPGMYQVLFKMNGTTVDNNQFNREIFFHKYVDVGIRGNWDDSNIKFKPLPYVGDSSKTRVSVTFKDKYGNIPLPERSEMIQIIPDHGILHGKLVDRLDGTYTQDIVYDPVKGKPKVTVKYNVVEFPLIPVTYFPKWSVGPDVRMFFPDDDFSFSDHIVWGIDINRYLTDRWDLEGFFGIGRTKDTFGDKGSLFLTSLNTKFVLINGNLFRPYVLGGISSLRFDNLTTDDHAVAVNFGIGFNFMLSDYWGIQFEAKDYLAFKLYRESTSHNIHIGGGIVRKIY